MSIEDDIVSNTKILEILRFQHNELSQSIIEIENKNESLKGDYIIQSKFFSELNCELDFDVDVYEISLRATIPTLPIFGDIYFSMIYDDKITIVINRNTVNIYFNNQSDVSDFIN